MTKKRLRWKSRRAFVTVYMALSMLVLVPMVGLAIDTSVLYFMRDRIQQAVDAGAIGAGNMVQRSTDVTDSATNANEPRERHSDSWNAKQASLSKQRG